MEENNINQAPVSTSEPNQQPVVESPAPSSNPIPPTQPSQIPSAPVEPFTNSPKKKNNTLFICLITTLLVVVIVAVVLVILLPNLTSQNNSDSGNSSNSSGSTNNNQSVQEVEQLQIAQRDTARRNDISRTTVGLVQYQTNHAGKLPEGPAYWQATTTFNCDNSDEVCKFAAIYLNPGIEETTNNFTDPDGTPYSIYISENYYDNPTLTTSFGNTASELVPINDGFTIGGTAPFSEHIIYIIPGGKCSEDSVIKGASARAASIMYQLENGTVYCLDA